MNLITKEKKGLKKIPFLLSILNLALRYALSLFFIISLFNSGFADEYDDDIPSTATGEWCGVRTYLRKKGIEFKGTMDLDNTWNLHGGIRPSPYDEFGSWFDFSLKITSEPLFHFEGGTFFIDYQSHHGQNPSVKDVGSYIFVDNIEGPSLDILYALWYKQQINDRFWILVGKSDAYDNFTTTTHSYFFLNAAYMQLPSIPFFPTYPNPAMSVVASLTFMKDASITVGLFDGSSAQNFQTGRAGVFGKFFNRLDAHAFIIAEADFSWEWFPDYKGRLGLGHWKTTASLNKFSGGRKQGTGGSYITFDQVLFAKNHKVVGGFFLYGSGNPTVNPIPLYLGTGLTFEGFIECRDLDRIGIGMSRVNFSQKEGAGFTENYEASYELFYQWYLSPFFFIQPDFQYVVNPGGQGLPNASVFTVRLEMLF